MKTVILVGIVDGEYRYGLCDYDGNIVIEACFEEIFPLKNGAILVKQEELWGYLDEKGLLIIDFKYYAAKSFSKGGVAPVRLTDRPGSWGLVNKKGEVIPLPHDYGYYDISEFNDAGIAIARYYARYYLINERGELVDGIPYLNLSYSAEQGLFIGRPSSKYYIINENEQVIVNPEKRYGEMTHASQGLYSVSDSSDLWGYMDRNGEEVIPCQFSIACPFSDNDLAAVRTLDNQFGFIDKTGTFVIEPLFENASEFCCGLAAVKKGNLYYYIDEHGNDVFQRGFLQANAFTRNGLAQVTTTQDERGFIGLDGQIKFLVEGCQVSDFDYHQAITTYQKDGKFGLFSYKGVAITDAIFDKISLSPDFDLHLVKKDGEWGYIDSHGKIRIPCRFTRAGHFGKNAMAVVSIYDDALCEEQLAMIDLNGDVVAELSEFPTSGPIGTFSDTGRFRIKLDNGYFFIGSEAEHVTVYEFASEFYKGESIVSYFEPECLLTSDGKQLPLAVWGATDNDVIVALPGEFD